MLPVRAFNQRKVIKYSFYVLTVCVFFYFVICLGTYYVDSDKLLPAGPPKPDPSNDIIKRDLPPDIELPQVIDQEPRQKEEVEVSTQGRVNMHVFEDCCGASLNNLRSNLLYPLFPNVRTTVSRLAISPQWQNYGLRLFGYIHPKETGEYIFAVGSDDNSEFWLSLNESPQNLQLLAYVGENGNEWTAPGEYWKFASQISKPVLLVKDMKYFFEAILKQSEGMDHLEIAWRLNHDSSIFQVITSEFLSEYEDESTLKMGDIDHVPQTEASSDKFLEPIPILPHPGGDMVRKDPRDYIFKIPMMEESYMKGLFPECHYKPSYIIGTRIERYQGVNLIHLSSVYPNDYTRQTYDHDDQICFYKQDPSFQEKITFSWMAFCEIVAKITEIAGWLLFKKWLAGYELSLGFAPYLSEVQDPEVHVNKNGGPNWQRVYEVKPFNAASKQSTVVANSCKTAGNIIMAQNEVMPIVNGFMKALQSKEETRGFSLLRVLNVVRRQDNGVGSRYLVELELVGPQGQKVLASRYVYTTQTEMTQEPVLCSPKDFNWNPSATVHIIVAVKNQARWVIQFIREMEKVYRATGDKNFNVIIIDYNSNDIDIEKILKKSKLPSYIFKNMEGNFQRSGGLQAGIDLVKDPHSIVFLCDLHLYYPVHVIDSIRKHTIEGKMVYAPVVMRLNCGASTRAPTGFWESAGYGLMGLYKSDIDRIGGMNTEEFKDKWGGEDWELLDRVLGNGLEVERLHLRNFLHHYHSKRGMWQENTT